MFGGQHIIHPAYRRVVGCALHQFGVGGGLLGDAAHHRDESIDGVEALALGRLYHQRLMEEQREIDGGCMIAVVEQAFGHVHGGDTRRFVFQTIEDELMLAQTADGQQVEVFQRLLDVVSNLCCHRRAAS